MFSFSANEKENIILKQNGDVAEFVDGVLQDTYEHIKVDDILIDGESQTLYDFNSVIDTYDHNGHEYNGVYITFIWDDNQTHTAFFISDEGCIFV